VSDNVLAATTVADFIAALNRDHQLNLSIDSPEGILLTEWMQNTPIRVTRGNGEGTSYTAQVDLRLTAGDYPAKATFKIVLPKLDT
jgi:hypothetical protein